MSLAASKGKTFASILQDNKGAGPGFDLLRLGLALTIMASHCSMMSGNRGLLSSLLQDVVQIVWPAHGNSLHAIDSAVVAAQDTIHPAVKGLGRPYTLSHLPMFFALSGFLVSGSAFRTRKVIPFLGLRALRIFPALCVEVLLSAFLLGAIFTTLPLGEYFNSHDFLTYFGNMFGVVQLRLPGVFTHTSPSDMVNGNLWTLPAELHAYLIAAALIVSRIFFNRVVFTALFAVASVALLIANSVFGYNVVPGTLDADVNVYYFFCGVLFFLWKDRIVYSVYLFLVCGVATYVLMFSTHTVYVYPLMLTYVTAFIGLTSLPKFKFLKSGDYSYGIYLYGFPISQALVATAPALKANFTLLFLLAVLVTSFFSFLSWHLVEKHFMLLKRFLSLGSARIAKDLHPDTLDFNVGSKDYAVAPRAERPDPVSG